MQLFLHPDSQAHALSVKELSCLVHPGDWWHCTTAELKILVLLIIIAAIAIALLVKNRRGK
jgi:subtilase family serine protease